MVTKGKKGYDDEAFAPYVPRLLQSWPKGVHYLSREGTMLFMDISGFTALSERLAEKGRIGAEQVADALNHTFTELLTIAVDLGADPLKFGGDATLQFYEGDNHTERAARAAALMRARLRSVGKVDTPQGVLQLRMSQGIHTGHFDFFKVACSHQELIVTGPGASTTVRMEGIADAGEILLSPAASERLAPSLVGKPKEQGFLLARAPAPPRVVPPSRERTEYSLDQFTPAGLRPYLAGHSEGEHRRATIAFLKIKGTDDRIAVEGEEAVCDWLQQIMVSVLSAVELGDVTFLSTDIDEGAVKIILSTGVPVTTGNDDERMLHTLRAIADGPAGEALAIGVNRGTVFAGDLGAPFRRYYTVLGDGVNLAARVMSQAHLGQVLATPEVLDRSPTIFETEDLEPFMVKGKSQPVHAALVGRAIGTRDETESRELPLIGRQRELDAILAAFEESRLRGGAIEVEGPSGSGKSRLFGEAFAATQPVEWLKVSCEEYQRITPYAPFAALLRHLLGARRGDPEIMAKIRGAIADVAPELLPWLPLLAPIFDLEIADTPETAAIDERFSKDRRHEVLVDYLGALRPRHTVFLFDNGQWMDEASGELLAKLLQAAPKHPWLIAVARRPDEGGASLPEEEADRVHLGELSHRDQLELAAVATEGNPLPRPQVEAIIERSGGNPLFLLEMLEASTREGMGDLPGSIEELITARIDRLDPSLRRLLRYGSAFGRRVDVGLLIDSVGDDVPEASDPVNWSALSAFLEPDGDDAWRFRQNLFRDVAYASLPFGVRRELHARIGDLLEARSDDPARDADILSLHFSIAGDHERTWQYSTIAATRAREQYANVEAVDFFRRAIEAASHVPALDSDELARIHEALGDVAELAGLYDEATRAFRHARHEFKGEARATARVMSKQGLLREKAGDLSNALRWFSRGLSLLEKSETSAPEERAELQIAYAGVRFRQGRFGETIEWAQRALDDLPVADGLRAQRAHALSLLVLANANLRRPIESYGEEALGIYEDLGDLFGLGAILNNLGIDAFYKGHWPDATRLWERSREARLRAGDVVGAASSVNNLGEIYVDQGHLDQAFEAFNEALVVWGGAPWPAGVAIAHLNLGRTAARAGNTDVADEHLSAALEDFEEIGAHAYIKETRARTAEAMLLRGDFEAALRECDQLISSTPVDEHNQLIMATTFRIRGYCLLGFGHMDEARADFEKSLTLGRAGDSGLEVALTLEAMIRCSPADPTADDWYEESVVLLDRLGVVATPLVAAWPRKVSTSA